MALDDGGMNDSTRTSTARADQLIQEEVTDLLGLSFEEARTHLTKLAPKERLEWALEKFQRRFVLTTSFGVQSSVLLHMLHCLKGGDKVPVIWVDTGYLPKETYLYADLLSKRFDLDIKPVQSEISPARMEALYGLLWETDSVEDLEKYHLIRKVKPLENALNTYKSLCWASGVRGSQTDHRKSMTPLDLVRGRCSLRPLLNWSTKDVFYYMQEHDLPQHPLFEKGYSTVGDWHSSSPDTGEASGRKTRFGGLKQECGIHMPGVMGEGI